MRVILADDATLLREGLVRLLAEEGHEVAAAVGDAPSLLSEVDRHRPGVAVVDVRMPPTHTDDGLRAALEIRSRFPEVGVLVLSQHVEKRYAVERITGDRARVGCLLEDRVVQVDEFLDALERVARGGVALDPEVVRRLPSTEARDPLADLAPRERDVLDQMAQGRTNAGIAAHLHVSQSAVDKHVNSIFAKLALPRATGCSRRVLAVLRYLESSSDGGRG